MGKRGWIVTFAGTGLNLTLGILYAWSMFSKQLTETVANNGFGWSKTSATLPYTIAIACFALVMVPAGRLQDKFGPRIVATTGAILAGLGLIVAGFASSQEIFYAILGFGVLGGTGIGLGYAAATPAAVKWFSAEKKGLIVGLVVGGFGLAPVYIAPLSKYLLATYGISSSFMILGIAFSITATLLALLITNPRVTTAAQPLSKTAMASSQAPGDYTWREMLKTPRFYSLYLQFACAATAGLMIIGHLAKIVSVQSGNQIKIGFVFVALLAVFNASGRIVAGFVSDYIGRVVTIALVCTVQALIIFFFPYLSSINDFILGSVVVGFNYGACLALFPATTADYWGTKNLGLNYGILFTSWGVGGILGPLLAGKIADTTGTYGQAYTIAAGLLLFAVLLAMISYINVSVNISERELTIKLGERQLEKAD
ncbi:MAG TPA: OFA family MFS transporter [Thermodesulfobacteriota bacterium]|nr:OFA family MFS transporter [Thermodesulfobacteriota bacterium]